MPKLRHIHLRIEFLGSSGEVLGVAERFNLSTHWDAVKQIEPLMVDHLKDSQNSWLNWEKIAVHITRIEREWTL